MPDVTAPGTGEKFATTQPGGAGTDHTPHSIPVMTSGGHISAATNGTTGATFTAFGSQLCKQVTIVNDTGTKIEVQQDGAGVALPINDGTSFTFFGLTNANQLGVRRVDQTTVVATVKARWEN